MSVEGLIEVLTSSTARPGAVPDSRVLVIETDGRYEIRKIPAGLRAEMLKSGRWPRLLLITPPPRGEIRIEPGLMIAWSGGAPNPAGQRLVTGQAGADSHQVRGQAVVMRYRAGGVTDLDDVELLWLHARLEGFRGA